MLIKHATCHQVKKKSCSSTKEQAAERREEGERGHINTNLNWKGGAEGLRGKKDSTRAHHKSE